MPCLRISPHGRLVTGRLWINVCKAHPILQREKWRPARSPTLLLIERKPGSWAQQASRIRRLLQRWYQLLLLVESSVRAVVSVACVNAVYQASNLMGWHKAYFECGESRLLFRSMKCSLHTVGKPFAGWGGGLLRVERRRHPQTHS